MFKKIIEKERAAYKYTDKNFFVVFPLFFNGLSPRATPSLIELERVRKRINILNYLVVSFCISFYILTYGAPLSSTINFTVAVTVFAVSVHNMIFFYQEKASKDILSKHTGSLREL